MLKQITAASLCMTAPLMAFQAEATGLYASSQLTTSVGFVEAHFANPGGYQAPEGQFSVFGVEFNQMLGFGHWVSLDLYGGFGVSLGGVAYEGIAFPGKMKTYDLGASLYSSLPCTKDQRLFIEPTVGFFGLKLNARENLDFSGYPGHKWVDLRYWGPMAGLFLRMMPLDKFEVRVGGAYLMPRLWEKVYGLDREQRLYQFHGARSGLLAALSLSYEATDSFSLYVKLDYQTLGTSGGPVDGDVLIPHMFRSRLVWGSSLSY